MSVGSVNGVGTNLYLSREFDDLKSKNKAANLMFVSGMGITSSVYFLDKYKSSFLKRYPVVSAALLALGGLATTFGMLKSIGTHAKIKEIEKQINVNV